MSVFTFESDNYGFSERYVKVTNTSIIIIQLLFPRINICCASIERHPSFKTLLNIGRIRPTHVCIVIIEREDGKYHKTKYYNVRSEIKELWRIYLIRTARSLCGKKWSLIDVNLGQCS